MKKIEILIGSPRKNGNTFALTNKFSNLLNKNQFSINTTFICDLDILPCNDCRSCKKNDYTCIIEDSMKVIDQKLITSDIIIFATPIYWYGPTAYIKLLIDRLRPYFVNKNLAGKRAALLLPAGDGEIDCDLTIEMFKRIFKTLEIEYIGVVTAKAYNIGDLNEDTYSKESLLSIIKMISY